MPKRRDQAELDRREHLAGDPVFAVAQVAVLAKIILTVLVFDPRSFDAFALPKSVAAHALSLVVVALIVWLVARHGRGVLVWSPLHLGAGALLVAFAAATVFAVDPTVALFGAFKRYLGLTHLVDSVVLYFAVATLFRDARSLRLLAGVGIGVAVPVLAYAAVQRVGLDPFHYEEASTTIPISTLGNPDIASGLVSILGTTALGLAFLLPGRLLTPWRASLAAISLACIGLLYATGTRSGALAVAAGWVAVSLLAFLLPAVTRRQRLLALSAAPALAIALALSPVGARLQPAVLQGDLAITSRFEIWDTAVEAWRERPVLGLGPDNFAAAYPARRNEASVPTGTLQNSTHDLWLYLATSAGAAGVLAMLFLLGLAIVQIVGLARRGHPAALAALPLAAYLGQALVNVNEISLDWTLWVALGVIAGGAGAPLAAARPERSRTAPAIGGLAIAAAILLTFTTVLPRIVSGEAMLAAEAYSSAGRRAEGIANGQAAVAADPRRGESWSTYGSALYRSGSYAAAVSAFGVAAERQPWHPLSWKNLAVAWAALGNQDAAYAAAKRVPEVDPFDGEGRDILAQLAFQRGDYQRAALEGEKAVAYRLPPIVSTWFTVVSAYVRLKDLPRAEALARRGVEQYPVPQLRLQLAAIRADLGDRAEALSIVDAILASEPTNAEAQRLKGLLTSTR